MKFKLKNHWSMLKLLLLINAVLISAIILMHSSRQRADIKNDSGRCIKNFSADAINSITIKLM